MGLEAVVEDCYKVFEKETGREPTEPEKKAITIACIKGESYMAKKFVEAYKSKRQRRPKGS